MEPLYDARFTRRDMLKLTAGGAGLLALGGSGLAVMRGFASGGGNIYLEAFPTSPLILEPFRADNPLPVPAAERPSPPPGGRGGSRRRSGRGGRALRGQTSGRTASAHRRTRTPSMPTSPNTAGGAGGPPR